MIDDYSSSLLQRPLHQWLKEWAGVDAARLILDRLIPVGPYELREMLRQDLSFLPMPHPPPLMTDILPGVYAGVPRLPWSPQQLADVARRLDDEDCEAVLTLDLPAVGGSSIDLRRLLEWFGNPHTDPSFGQLHPNLLTVNDVQSDRFRSLANAMGVLSQEVRWSIRYQNLPHWGAGLSYSEQCARVQGGGCIVPSAIGDAWSILIGRLFLKHCKHDKTFRVDHCGRTGTMFENSPIAIHNLQYRLGLLLAPGSASADPDVSAEPHMYVCCEVPPPS